MNERLLYKLWYKKDWKKCLVSSLLIIASVSQGNDNDYTPAISIDQTYKIKSELLDLLSNPEDNPVDTCVGCKSDGKGFFSKPPWLFLSTNHTASHQEITVYVVLNDAQVSSVDSRLNQVSGLTDIALNRITTVINQASEMLSDPRERDIDPLLSDLQQARQSEYQIAELRYSVAQILEDNELPGEPGGGLPRLQQDISITDALVDRGEEMNIAENFLDFITENGGGHIMKLNAIIDYANSIKKVLEHYKQWVSIIRSFLPKPSGG